MLENIFVSAGCTQKPHISTVSNGKLFYGSFSNILVANSQFIEKAILLDSKINAVKCHDDLVLAGDINGRAYIVNGAEIFKLDLPSSIQCIGILGDSYVFCTLQNIFIIEEVKYRKECYKLSEVSFTKISTDQFITCVETMDDRLFVGTLAGKILCIDKTMGILYEVDDSNDALQDVRAYNEYLATSSQDTTIKIWKYENKQLVKYQVLNGHSDWIYNLFFTKSGDLISSSADKCLLYWKKDAFWLNTHRLGGSATFYNAMILDKYIIAQSHSGGFYKFKDEPMIYISGHTGEIQSLDWNGEFLLSGSSDMTTRIIFRGYEVARPQIHGYPITAARFLHEDSFDVITAAKETIIRILEPTEVFYLSCLQVKDCGYQTIETVGRINDNSTRLKTSNKSVEVLQLMNNHGDTAKSQIGDDFYRYFDKLETYQTVAVPAELSLTNEVLRDFTFESVNEQLLSTTVFTEANKLYGHYFEVSDVAVSPKFIASCNKSSLKKFSGIFLWSKDCKLIQYLKEHDLGIQRLKFSPDGKYLGAVSRDKTASLYMVTERLELFSRLKQHSRMVWDCCFSSDNKYFVTCSRDKKVHIYNIDDLSYRIIKSRCEATAVGFNNLLLCVGLEDGYIQVYNDLDLVYELKAHSNRVNVIEFNKSGNLIATGGADGMIRVFRLS